MLWKWLASLGHGGIAVAPGGEIGGGTRLSDLPAWVAELLSLPLRRARTLRFRGVNVWGQPPKGSPEAGRVICF